MQNILRFAPAIAASGVFVASMKMGKVAMIDIWDIAAVVAVTLTTDGHAGKAYTITGPEALSMQDVATKLSAATGKQVSYTDEPPEGMRRRMLAAGTPDWLVEVRMEFNAVLREGYASAVTDMVEVVTGKPPRSFGQFAREHASLLKGTARA